MAAGRVASAAIFALASLLCISVLSVKQPVRGFSVDRISSDSLNSHHSNPNGNTRFARIQSDITRSIATANQISTLRYELDESSDPPLPEPPLSDPPLPDPALADPPLPDPELADPPLPDPESPDPPLPDPETEIFPFYIEYTMNVSIGTPPFSILVIADMTSDLIWTKCNDRQNTSLFKPKNSTTYVPISCSASQCTNRSENLHTSCDNSKNCHYEYDFSDELSTTGTIATETLTIGNSNNFSEILFGCGYKNQMTTSNAAVSGKIGLGNGSESLISQIEKTIDGKFSYCLSNVTTKSMELKFGENATVSGNDVVTTRLVPGEPDNLYWLKMKSITVGNVTIRFPKPESHGDDKLGNTIIDTGTTHLSLPGKLYDVVENEIMSQVNGEAMRVEARLCYETKSFKAPEIVVHFDDGADLKLNGLNMFVEVKGGLTCFACSPSWYGEAAIGSFVQMNFLIGFDKVKKTVSFKPDGCSD